MNERKQFVVRLEAGEGMSELCREYGISRKSGYKFWDRFRRVGPTGLFDQSRKPIASPKRTPDAIRKVILDTKREKPHWGASKIRSYLARKQPGLKLPSRNTLHGILDQNGLVTHKGKRRFKTSGEQFQQNVAQ
ncbi:MAG: helix-turn-helix domain-containing protein, partial [Bdellovibrionota bacterium]